MVQEGKTSWKSKETLDKKGERKTVNETWNNQDNKDNMSTIRSDTPPGDEEKRGK